MAKKPRNSNEFDLDDFDLDNLDFDIPEFDADKPSNDRKATDRLKDGFFKGVKDSSMSSATLEKLMRQALPPGYSQALNAKDAVIESGRELWSAAYEELRPAAQIIDRATQRALSNDKFRSKLPKSLLRRLDARASSSDGGMLSPAAMKAQQQNSEVSQAIMEVFQAQTQVDNEARSEEKAQRLLRDGIEDKRSNTLLEQTNIIARGIDRLVGYQDNILSKYQQKKLELAYRHYFVSREMLESSNVQNEKVSTALAAIVKNTALPEAVKIQRSEMAGQLLKERLINAGLDRIGSWAANYGKNLTANLQNVLRGTVGGFAGTAGMMPEGIDPATEIGRAIGGQATSWVAEQLGMMLRPHLEGNQRVRQGNAYLRNALTGVPQKMDRWAKSETEGYGWLSMLVQSAKDVAPKFYLNDKVGGQGLTDMDRPAIFDNMARRSIVEIIPSYLAQIERWTKAGVTGQLEEARVWSAVRGSFVADSRNQSDIRRSIMPRNENILISREFDDFIGQLDDGNSLSPEARKALKRQLLGDVSRGEGFVASSYGKRETYKNIGDERIVNELRGFFTQKFGLGYDGTIQDNSLENKERLGNASVRFDELGRLVPATGDRIRAMVDIFGKDNLRKMGIIVRVGFEDRIDYEKLWDLMLEEKFDSGDVGRVKTLAEREAEQERYKNLPLAERIKRQMEDTKRDQQRRSMSLNDGGFDDDAEAPVPIQVAGRKAGGGNVNIKVGQQAFEPYLGQDSAIIAELRSIRDAVYGNRVVPETTDSMQTLRRIEAILMSGHFGGGFGGPGPDGAGPGGPGMPRGGIGGLLNRGVKGLGRFGKWYGEKTLQFYGALGSGAWKTGKLPFKVGRWLVKGRKFGQRTRDRLREAGDVLVKGQDIPALRKRLMEAGEYIDVNTKKVIRSVEDITGEVKDRAGNLILDQKEYAKGLYDAHGKSLIRRATEGWIKLSTLPARMTWEGARTAGTSLWNKITSKGKELMDGYLPGETEPRIRAAILKAGGYFDEITKKPIFNYADIKGNVVDRFGNLVVSAQELGKADGLYAKSGEKIREKAGLIKKALKGYWTLATAPFKAGQWSLNKLRSSLNGMFSDTKAKLSGKYEDVKFKFSGDPQDDSLKIQAAQLKVLNRIAKSLHKSRVAGDVDGDGVRENSVMDLIRKRLRKRSEEKEAKAAAKSAEGGKLGQLMTSIGGALGGIKSFFTKKAEEDGDGDTNIDVDWWDTGDKKEKRGGRRGGRGGRGPGSRAPRVGGGKWAKVRGVAKEGLKMGWEATKWGGRMLGRALLWGGRQILFRGIMWAGGALLSAVAGVLSAPVLITAAVVGAVAVGGYLLYQHLKEKTNVLLKMRMAQYGVEMDDETRAGTMLWLENLLDRHVVLVDDKYQLDASKVGVGEILTKFGHDMNSDDQEKMGNFLGWFEGRFKPVFLANKTAQKNLSVQGSLAEVDSKVPRAMGLEYIAATRLDSLKEKYDDMTSPFADRSITEDADDVEDAIEEAEDFYKKAMKDDLKKEANPQKQAIAQSAMGMRGGAAVMAARARAQGLNGNLQASAIVAAGTTTLAMMKNGESMQAVEGKLPTVMTREGMELAIDEVVRFKVYGLKDLVAEKVDTLRALEGMHWGKVKYTPEKVAYLESSLKDEVFSAIGSRFGVSLDDKDNKTAWFTWYQFRFLPAFLQYATGVRLRANVDAKDAGRILKSSELRMVLTEVGATTSDVKGNVVSVWAVIDSPWPGYQLASMPGDIQPYLDFLRDKDKAKIYTDEFSRKALGLKSATGAAVADQKANLPMVLKGYATGDIKTDRGGWAKYAQVYSGKGGAAGNAGTPSMMLGMGMTGGTTVQHPGGGTGGDINSLPEGGKGWAASKDLIVAAAKMVGVDPVLAATTAAIESRFDPAARPWSKKEQRYLSSATGYYQFIDDTWAMMLKKYGSTYGIAPNTPSTDPRANAILGAQYLKDNYEFLKKRLGREIRDTDLYLAHFLGPEGAATFLSAPQDDVATRYVGASVPSSNESVFFDNGRPRTVAEVYQEMNRRLDVGRKLHDLTGSSGTSTVAQPNQPAANDASSGASGAAAPQGSTDGAKATNYADGFSIKPMSTAPGLGPVPKATEPSGLTSPASNKPSMMLAGVQTPPMPTDAGPSATDVAGDVKSQTTAAAQYRAVTASKQAEAAQKVADERSAGTYDVLQKQLEVQQESLGTLKQILAAMGNRDEEGKASGLTTAGTSAKPTGQPLATEMTRGKVDVSRKVG